MSVPGKLTNYPNGVTSFGGIIVPDIPGNGKRFWVDPVNGSASYDGRSPQRAFAKLSTAHGYCTAGKNDVVYLIGDGASTGSARETATLTWSKDATHLIGVTAPTMVAQRARIATASGSNFTPLMTVTANGCIFSNFSMFHGYDTAEAQICLRLTNAQRNYFSNVHIGGIGHATAGDDAGSASLHLDGASENTFDNCMIGLDTIARSTSNAEILIDVGTGACTRNIFRRCFISSYADNAGHFFVAAAASGAIDRYVWFDDCTFYNAVGSAATTMTAGMSIHATVGGLFLLTGSTAFIGCTDIANAFGNIRTLAGSSHDSDYSAGAALADTPT